MTTIVTFSARLALAGLLLALGPASLRPTIAAPDNTRGMALLSANVDGNGTLRGGSGAVSVNRFQTGSYYVYFDRPVNECTYTVSRRYSNPPTPGVVQAGIINQTAADTFILVWMTDTAGNLTDYAFTLLVFCSK